MPWDEGKTIGVKSSEHVPVKDRNKYIKEEEEAQNKSKKSRVEYKSQTSNSQRMFNGRFPSPHASEFSLGHSGHRTISNFPDQGYRNDVDTKIFRFLNACGPSLLYSINDLRKKYGSIGNP